MKPFCRHIVESRHIHICSYVVILLILSFLNKVDEAMDIMCTDDEIDMRSPFEKTVLPFLRHATGNGNNEIWLFIF